MDGEMDAQRSYSVGRRDEISNSSCATVTSANRGPLKSSSSTTLQQTISTESVRRNFPPSDYYPIIHLNKQSNSINNISSTSNINKARPQSSIDYTPVWCLDDTKQPGNRPVSQSKDGTVSCYHTDGCQQYSASSSSSLRKPSAYQIPWKEEISIEKKLHRPSIYPYNSSTDKSISFTKLHNPGKSNTRLRQSNESLSRSAYGPYNSRRKVVASATQSTAYLPIS
ncbi:unnamed protein product [Trichobilharzia szidati]|nr:unnamed protein product [Trichobilharzia szidati]